MNLTLEAFHKKVMRALKEATPAQRKMIQEALEEGPEKPLDNQAAPSVQ